MNKDWVTIASRQLLVDVRPGLYVVSGYVQTYDLSKRTVTIRNKVWIRSKKTMAFRQATIAFKEQYASVFDRIADSIKTDSFVFAMIRPNINIRVLGEGGENSIFDYYCEGKNILFTGSMDIPEFAPTKSPEQHVFCGAITKIQKKQNRGKIVYEMDFEWNTAERKEHRTIYTMSDKKFWNPEHIRLDDVRKCIVRTGAPQKLRKVMTDINGEPILNAKGQRSAEVVSWYPIELVSAM